MTSDSSIDYQFPRRSFLVGTASTVLVACSSNNDGASSDGGPSTSSTTTSTTTTQAANVIAVEAPPAPLDSFLFPLGVGSGDPTSDSVILWTRLAADPLVVDGGLPLEDVEVAFDIAVDPEFATLVASDITTATAAMGHSIHLDAIGLAPETAYFFRFRLGDQTSPSGRAKTMAQAGTTPDQFRFVMASCMDRQWGHYGAWRRAAETEDLDAIIFLGDFIYEVNIGDGAPEGVESRAWTVPEPFDLDTFRTRYGQTLTDPSLQSARQAAPWIMTWDDHEVVNNYAGDTDPLRPDEGAFHRARRSAAYQAWYENQPVRLDVPDDWADFPIHRSVTVGDLATIHVTETRQYADEPPCRGEDENNFTDTGGVCDTLDDDTRTNLGADQEAWLHESLSASSTLWNLIANPILLSGIDVAAGDDPPRFELDSWDGYPGVRRRLVEKLADESVSNPVILTGDWHASFVLDLNDANGITVAPEFLVTSISTIAFSDDYRARNPHMRYFGDGNGFATCTVTADDFTTTFSYISDQWDADASIAGTATWRVLNGEHQAAEVT